MWELDYKESWVLKNWCFWTVVLEKTLESPLNCKEIQPVNPKGNKSWIFIGRTDTEAETLIMWLQSPSAVILEPKKIKPLTVSIVSPSICHEVMGPDAMIFTLCEELTHWKRPWCWERLKVGGEGDNRGWDGWMASPTRRTWVWVSSGSCWRTGKLGVLQSMELQRAGHNWET